MPLITQTGVREDIILIGDQCIIITCGLEGIQIHYHEVDVANAIRPHFFFVFGVTTDAQKATMHLWMQRLHTTIQNLRRTRVIRHIDDRQTRIAHGLGGTTRRQ
jgi:hypothetical protein